MFTMTLIPPMAQHRHWSNLTANAKDQASPRVKRAKSYLSTDHPIDDLNGRKGASSWFGFPAFTNSVLAYMPQRVFLYMLGSIHLLGMGGLGHYSYYEHNRVDVRI